jgi:hypothetical protein
MMLFSILLILPACNRNEPRSTQAAREERTDVTDQLKAERDTYVKSMDARLAEFDQKLDGLDKRANAMTGATKTDFENAIKRLRDERKSVADKLGDLKKVKPESWQTMKGEVDSAFASLERSYMQVSDMFNKVPSTSTTPRTKTY